MSDEAQGTDAHGPLHGIRVLEFSQIVAGPVAGLNLADLGADVIKVEPPAGDSHRNVGSVVPNESKMFQGNNRGKRGIVLDLHEPRAQEVVHRMAPEIDVVVINHRPGVAQRLSIDYETLREFRPDLIYLQLTGFGEEGPEAGRAGSDIVAQSYSGLMVTDGKREEDGAPAEHWLHGGGHRPAMGRIGHGACSLFLIAPRRCLGRAGSGDPNFGGFPPARPL